MNKILLYKANKDLKEQLNDEQKAKHNKCINELKERIFWNENMIRVSKNTITILSSARKTIRDSYKY